MAMTYAVYKNGKLIEGNIPSEIKAIGVVHRNTASSFDWALRWGGFSVIGTDPDTGKEIHLRPYTCPRNAPVNDEEY